MEYSSNPEMPPLDYISALEFAYDRLTDELPLHLHNNTVYHSFGEVLLDALFLDSQVGVV